MGTLYMTPGVYLESASPTTDLLAENLTNTPDNIILALDYAKVNAATSASNVIVAINAFLKLASDAGSIFSIISAADFESEIYNDANALQVDINSTASLGSDVLKKAIAISLNTSAISVTKISITGDVQNAVVECDTQSVDLVSAIGSLKEKANSSLQLLNQFSAIVTQKKALNPLISDELVARISTAINDANQINDLLNTADLTAQTALKSIIELMMML